MLCSGKRDEGSSENKKKATVERLFHLEMKGADGERAISKGNIITFSYVLLEHCGGGRGRKEAEGRGWRRRGAFKSNNPSLRYTRFSHSHSPSSLFTFHPNLSILLYISPFCASPLNFSSTSLLCSISTFYRSLATSFTHPLHSPTAI